MKSLVFLLAFAGAALASDLDFVLSNQTARSFEAIYLSAVSNKDWDGNLMPNGRALEAGGRVAVKFPKEASEGRWDLNLVDDEGLIVRFEGLQLSGADQITLTEKNGRVTAEVE